MKNVEVNGVNITVGGDISYPGYIDIAKGALLRLGKLMPEANDDAKSNYMLLGVTLDALSHEMTQLKADLRTTQKQVEMRNKTIDKLRRGDDKPKTGKTKDTRDTDLTEAEKREMSQRLIETITKLARKRLDEPGVRSETRNDATEMTKGYDLFAEMEKPTIRAYMGDDRIMEVKTSVAMKGERANEIVARAERISIKDYAGAEKAMIWRRE